MSKVLIVGGVAGGASCAARLRRLDESAQIVLFERGEYISYANCGLPYHVGGVIEPRDELLLMTPELMNDRFNVDVRVRQEVTAIDRQNKRVTVVDHASGNSYEESYDTLVLSPGSSPLRPPIPGIDSPRIRTLWTVPDTDEVRRIIREEHVQRALVIGGGFIGLEMAENLRHLGLEVSLVEAMEQVMAPLDIEMAHVLHGHIRQHGVELILGDGVDSFRDEGRRVRISLKSGRELAAELVILSIGVRPNGDLAKEAGLAVNQRGGIVVDAHMRTEDPAIYAVGDAVEVEDFLFGDPTMIPLAGPANKQGRIAADNIAGLNQRYEGSLGAAVAKVFDLTAASVGANEKALLRRRLVRGQDYETVLIRQNSHAGYYPGAEPMYVKLLFSMDGKKIYGAQAVGYAGVDKRIDTLAVAMRLGAAVQQLKALETSYAPPYSSAKDPVSMLGFMADNLLQGHAQFAPWDALDNPGDAQVLDVREDWELAEYTLPGATHIPLGELRRRANELNREKPVIVVCAAGVRAHTAARMLRNLGFKRADIYPGGAEFYRATHA